MEELYPTNYLTEERNYLKITTDQVVGMSSFFHLLLENSSGGLEKKRNRQKCCWKIVLETVHWGLDESRRIQIFEFPFCRKSFPSLEKCHTVLLLPQPRFRPNSNYWFPHRPTRSDNYFLAFGNWSSQPMPWQNSLFPKEFLLSMIYHPIFSAQAFLVGLKFQDSSLKEACLSESHRSCVFDFNLCQKSPAGEIF